MNRDHKIEKINAYRKLLETKKLPKIIQSEESGVDTLVAKELNSEFESWVESQLRLLLGEQVAASNALPFSNQEIEVLKTLIAGVQARRASAPAPQEETKRQVIKKDEPTLSDTEKARLNATARPLGNRKMVDGGRSNENNALVSMLDKMEDEGPNF